jgi:hypothetical protein
MVFDEQPVAPSHLILNMDAKFTKKFRDALASDGLEILRVGPRKPNLNAHAERFVQSIELECLDHFVSFGVEHLTYIIRKYEAFDNRLGPRQGRNNRTPPESAGDEPNGDFVHG